MSPTPAQLLQRAAASQPASGSGSTGGSSSTGSSSNDEFLNLIQNPFVSQVRQMDHPKHVLKAITSIVPKSIFPLRHHLLSRPNRRHRTCLLFYTALQ